jgi:hypothetical protein
MPLWLSKPSALVDLFYLKIKIYYKTPMKIGVFAFAKRQNNRILQVLTPTFLIIICVSI